MRSTFITTGLVSLLLASCDNSKSDTATGTEARKTSTEETTGIATPATNNAGEEKGTDGLVGRWQLQSNAFDGNKNKILDPEERAEATPNNSSYLFRADGTSVVQGSLKGHYEVKKENGAELLSVYRERIQGAEDEDPAPEQFRILSVNSSELVLLSNYSGNQQTFFILKRY